MVQPRATASAFARVDSGGGVVGNRSVGNTSTQYLPGTRMGWPARWCLSAKVKSQSVGQEKKGAHEASGLQLVHGPPICLFVRRFR